MNAAPPTIEADSRTETSMIEMIDVHKWFGDYHVLKGIHLTVQKQERIVICGPSGSGKSTLIRCINRLEEHQRGRIVVDGIELADNIKHIEKVRAEVGMVFQHFNLFPHLTILENLTLGPIWVRKSPKKEAEDSAMYFLEKVHIAEQAQKYPGQLSGGQQQRVAIARSLCMAPKVMLFDEVTSALDPEVIHEVTGVIRKLVATHNLTMLMVTHQMGFARDISDRVCFFYDGRIEEEREPEAFFSNPQRERTRHFLCAVTDAA